MQIRIFLAGLLTAVLLLIVVETKQGRASEFTGSYNTSYMRDLWFSCFTGIKLSNPALGQYFSARYCDCVLDTTRKKIVKSKLILMTKEKRKELFSKYAKACYLAPEDRINI